MKVHELTDEEIEAIRKARAEWGHKKYGDRDQFRDGAADLLEEALDILNILDRRLKWIEHDKKMCSEIFSKSVEIKDLTERLIWKIQYFDKTIRLAGYEVSDENGGERIGLDYLEYAKTAAESHKELE